MQAGVSVTARAVRTWPQMTDAVSDAALLDALNSRAQPVAAQSLPSDDLETEDSGARGALAAGSLLHRLLEDHVAHEPRTVRTGLPCYWVLSSTRCSGHTKRTVQKSYG